MSHRTPRLVDLAVFIALLSPGATGSTAYSPTFLASFGMVAPSSRVVELRRSTDKANSPSDEAHETEFLKEAKGMAAEYEFRLGTNQSNELTLHSEPILRWTNPVAEKQFLGAESFSRE